MNLFVDDTIWLTNGTIEDIELKLIRLETIFTKFGIKININKKLFTMINVKPRAPTLE